MTNAMQYPAKVSFTLTFNRNITLVTLVVLPVLISLGFWQLERAEEKRQLQAAFLEKQRQAPVALHSLNAQSIENLPDYTRVIAEGFFDNTHSWLLDNKIRAGRVGYEVLTPLLMENGQSVLINRGWIPAPARRDQIPVIQTVPGKASVQAMVFRPSDNHFLEASAENNRWPQVIAELDTETASKTLARQFLNLQLRIDEASVGAFTTGWKTVNTQPQKHTGYAVQWFVMAVVLVICFVCANSNLVSVIKSRRIKNEK